MVGGGSGSSDVQPRKVDYIWMHPSSLFKIEKDFLGWLNSGYEVYVQYRNITEYLSMSASYQGVLGCKHKDSTYPYSNSSYGYYIGYSSSSLYSSMYNTTVKISAGFSSGSSPTIGSYRNNKVLFKVDNDTIKYKNLYSYDYSYNTWVEPSSFSSITLPNSNTFSSLLTIYSSYEDLRSFFGYGSLLNDDGTFYNCEAIIGNLKVVNPSNNEVIVNYETWINNNTPYLKETVSNTTLNALWGSTVQEADRFNGWIEYVTDENGIVTRKEVPPKKATVTRGIIAQSEEIENNGQNENIVAEEIDYPREENQR